MGIIEHRRLIILGAGPAGLSAAIYAARAELKPLVITGMVLYGQVTLTNTIENYPGFPKGIGGIELGQLFEEQAKVFGTEFVYAHNLLGQLHRGCSDPSHGFQAQKAERARGGSLCGQGRFILRDL